MAATGLLRTAPAVLAQAVAICLSAGRCELALTEAVGLAERQTFSGVVQVLPSVVVVLYRSPLVPLPIRMTGPVQSPEGGLVISNSVSFLVRV